MRAFGLYAAALPVLAELQADLDPYDALPSGVSLIPYDSVPHTVLDSEAAVDAYLKEWTAANDRTPASAEQRCPPSCTESGSDPKNWHLYSDVAQLQLCNETLVFDFAVDQELDDKHTKGMFRACMADYGSSSGTKRASSSRAACSVVNPSKVKVNVELGWAGSAGSSDGSKAAVIAASQISQHIKSRKSICANNTVSFSSSGRTLVGLYAGSQVVSQGVAESVIDEFTSHAEKNGLSDKTVFQLCESKDRGADFAIGIVISLSGDVSFIQSTVKAWNNGACAPDIEGTKKWADFALQVPTIVTSSNTTSVRGLTRRAPPPANSDGTCTTKRVDGGDSCAALAAKCGISPADFTKINSDKDFCTGLVPGQYVCCSRGTLPDLTPKPEKDGSCAVYNIKDNDSCSSVAAAYGLTVDKLETFNKNTWGWNGCKVLWSGINICLSEGSAPMPAPVSNAVCGPTVPGTKKPTTGKNITELNPCPLKVCCNIWGQCGISSVSYIHSMRCSR